MEPRKLAAALNKHALGFPMATLDHPWGEDAFKVKGKVFVFMGADANEVSFSVKLPESRLLALSLPFTEPTHYGLGKSGWVTVHATAHTPVDVELLKDWIEESYRAVAPKKLAARLDDPMAAAPVREPRKAAKRPAKRAPPRPPKKGPAPGKRTRPP